MKNLKSTKIVMLALIAVAIAVFFIFDLGRFFTLEYIQSQRQDFMAFYQEHQWSTIIAYFLVYVLVTALSLPGATIMTLLGGAVFGLLVGTVVVSFASTVGATLAFLVSRFALRDAVQARFGDKLQAINEGVRREGAFYLFSLRLLPIFPFFLINLLMGLTPIGTLKFFLVSQIGMLAGTIVYVNAGSQLASIESLSGILSPGLLLSFALLGIFPFVAKKGLEFVKNNKSLRAESVTVRD